MSFMRSPVSGFTPLHTPEAQRNFHELAQRSMDAYIEVKRETSSPDGFGGGATTWVHVGRYPARIEQEMRPADSSELAGDQLSDVNYAVSVLPHADIRDADRLATPGWFNEWSAGAEVTAGDIVVPVGAVVGVSNYYVALNDGTTDDDEPSWDRRSQSVTTDNDVQWHQFGRVTYLEVMTGGNAQSNMDRHTFRCRELK